MNCRTTRELLPLHVGGDLDPTEVAALEEHLAGCESCREDAEAWRSQWAGLEAGLAASPRLDPPPELLDSAVSRATRVATEGLSDRRRRRPGWGLAAAAVVATVLLIGSGVLERRGSGTGPGPVAPGVAVPGAVAWTDLQSFFDECLSEPVAPARFVGPDEPGLVAVLARMPESGQYRVLECVDAPDLAALQAYPWLAQRLRRLEARAGEGQLVVAACGTGGLERSDRKRFRREFLAAFGPAEGS